MPLDAQTVSDYSSFKESVKDPALSAAYFLSKISDEKVSYNFLLREINAKLDHIEALESRVAHLEDMLKSYQPAQAKPQDPAPVGEPVLSEIDGQILAFVSQNGKCVAQEVADRFGYKGKNAACARLNRLAGTGLLSKKQAGRKVYYIKAVT